MSFGGVTLSVAGSQKRITSVSEDARSSRKPEKVGGVVSEVAVIVQV
jgi:hypothetical protein